jgi:hypothetical protein
MPPNPPLARTGAKAAAEDRDLRFAPAAQRPDSWLVKPAHV